MRFSPAFMQPFGNAYETVGMSYWYCATAEYGAMPALGLQKDPNFGHAGKEENWVRDPARYILISEPPALPNPPRWLSSGGEWLYFFWHYARGPSTVAKPIPTLTGVQDRCISPVLFADGHGAKHDFTLALGGDPGHPMEPQPDWYWYEPAP
jgi:hypothetical protein